MKLEHFHYLLEINKQHSISAAAHVLHVGQTTLSAAVKVIEDELGFSIFQRTPNGVATTPDGARLMDLAWEISVKYEELSTLRSRGAETPQFISLLLCPVVSMGFAIPLSRRFYQFELHGNLTFEEYPSSEIAPNIAANAANVGITYLSQKDIDRLEAEMGANKIVIEKLLPDRMHLFVSSGHRFASRDYVYTEEIPAERLAMVGKPSYDKVLGDLSLICPHVTVFASIDLMKQAVLTQGMVGMLPGYAICCDGIPDIDHFRMLPLRNTKEENLIFACLVYRGDRSLRYQERVLVSCIREYFRELPKTELAMLSDLWKGGEQQ